MAAGVKAIVAAAAMPANIAGVSFEHLMSTGYPPPAAG